MRLERIKERKLKDLIQDFPVSVKDVTKLVPVPDVNETKKALEEEIVKILNEIAGEYCKKILNVDYTNKEFRNRIVINKLVVNF